VPSFGVVNFEGDHNDKDSFFSNSLTVTRDDFFNFLHKDNDQIGHAYGWWWPAWLSPDNRYIFNEKYGHDMVKGGAFIWGKYKIGVDFQRYALMFHIYFNVIICIGLKGLLKYTGVGNVMNTAQ
jgi:hypothetical protein